MKLTAVALGVTASLSPLPSWAQAVLASSVSSTSNIFINADSDASNSGVDALFITASGVLAVRTNSTNTHIYTTLTVDGQITGNASTATFATTAGAVNAANLTGTTLAPGVINSSLTSLGTLTALRVSGPSTLTGVTSINTTGTAATTIGNSNALTTVSTNGGAGYTSIGNASSTMGTGTGGMVQTDASTATIRASSTGTLSSNGTSGTMSVNAGGGYSAYATSQNTGTGTIGGIVNNKLFTNKISGNTYVDGNLYINGTLDYVSSNSANTSVVGAAGTSVLPNASNAVSAGMAIVAKGSVGTQTVVDSHGKLTNVTGVAAESTASLTLTNGLGNTHGLVVTESQASLSGGTHSSTLTMADNGATFSDAQTGGPVQVHGVSDGTGDFDAVNVRQFAGAMASVTAMANIPLVDQDGNFALGVGVGGFMGKSALAAGMSYRFTRNGVFKASLSSAMGNSDTSAFGAGLAWSF